MFKCVSCDRNLKLIDQFLAEKVLIESTGEIMFNCSECVEQEKDLAAIDNKTDSEVTIN